MGSILISGTNWHFPGLFVLLYLDPGSGSMIIQLILAGILGVLFVFKSYWRKLINKIREQKDQEEDTNNHEDR